MDFPYTRPVPFMKKQCENPGFMGVKLSIWNMTQKTQSERSQLNAAKLTSVSTDL